jgi:hypothetical protein
VVQVEVVLQVVQVVKVQEVVQVEVVLQVLQVV